MKKRTSKLLSILLTLTMLLGLLPAMGTTALAAERETPDAGDLSIDGGVHFAEPSNLYYSTSTKAFVGSGDAWTAHYDPTSGVLTLKDYHGGPISLGSAKSLALTIDLQGTNEITESSTATDSHVVIAGISVTSGRGGDLSITSSTGGTLAISVSGTGPQVFGIVSDFGSLAGSGDVTISGKASVSIATSSNIQGDTDVYNCCAGISAYNVSILDRASLSSVQTSNCTLPDALRQTGVFTRSGVTINTTGTVSIDASQATENTNGDLIYSYGFNSSGVQLTNVGELTVKECCQTQSVTYDEDQYAYNEAHSAGVYTKNWRPGTAHTLTVVNGSNSFGNSVGQYLAGDKVSITARSIDGVLFKSWSADSGSITGSGSAATFITMPDGDATVTASFAPVSALTYTRISSTNGSISYTPVDENLVQSRRLIKNGGNPETGADVISYFYHSGDPFTAAAAPEGKYQIALQVGDVWHVSEPVYVWYDGFSAQPSFSGTADSEGTLTFAVNSRLGSPTVSLVKAGDKTVVVSSVSSGSGYTLAQGSYQLMFTVDETTYYSDSFKVLPAADGVFAVQPVFTGTAPSEGTITYTLADSVTPEYQRLIRNGGNPENNEDIIYRFLTGSYGCYKQSLTDGWYQVAVKIDSTWFKSQPVAVLYSPFGTWDSSSTSYTGGLPAFDPASGAVTYTWNAEAKAVFGAPEAYGLARITYVESEPSYSLVYDSLSSGTVLTEATTPNGNYCMAARYDGKWYYSPHMEIITNGFVGVPSAEWQEDGSVKITYELDSMVESDVGNRYLFKASDMSNTEKFVYSGSTVSQGALESVDTYVIGIQYQGNWYYSQPFTVDFRQPPYFAIISDRTLCGKVGTEGVFRENGNSFTGFNIGGDETNRKVFVSGGSLPAGLTLNSDGTFSGAPSECGKFTFSVTAQNESGSATLDCTLRVMGQPSFYPKDGATFTDTLYLFVGCDLAGATMRCSVNDSSYKDVSGGMIELTDTSTVQIQAYMDGYLSSDIVTATYTKVSKPEAPTASPASGNFVGSVDVTLSCSTQGASVYYTLNGNTPTNSSTPYSVPINLTDTTTIKAVSYKDGAYSDVAEFTYTKVEGYSVSGQVASYNPSNATTITLYDSADTAHATALCTTTIAATTGSGQKTQDFTLTGVASGTYDLVVTKAGHLTYTITGVVVGSENLDLTKNANASISTITLLCGDVNGDETINSLDLNMVWKSTNYLKSTSDVGVEVITDVNGDGTVNSLDLNIIWKSDHYLKSKVSYTYTG